MARRSERVDGFSVYVCGKEVGFLPMDFAKPKKKKKIKKIDKVKPGILDDGGEWATIAEKINQIIDWISEHE